MNTQIIPVRPALVALFLFYLSAFSPSLLSAVNVRAHGAVPDDGKDDSVAVAAAFKALPPGETLFFPAGTWQLDGVVWIENARNIRIVGEPGAVLVKKGRHQFLLAFRNAEDVTIDSLSFRGRTTDRSEPSWGDDGIYFGSCHRSTVKRCRFYDFGDAAIRMTSARETGGADSTVGRVLENYFDNVTQVTTNQGMEGAYGGTNDFAVEDNTFENLKASIKLACRAPTSGGRVARNHIRSSLRDGIQIESVSDVVIEQNTLEHIARVAVLINTNDHTPRTAPGFAWDRVAIRDNHITNVGSGVQGYLKPYADGSEFDHDRLVIVGNRFERITNVNDDAVIWLGNTTSGKSFKNLQIENNRFSNISKLDRVRLP